MSTAYAFEIACVKGVKNTRASACNFDPKAIEMAVLLPKGTTFTQAQLLAIKATLLGLAKDDDKTARIYPIKRFTSVEDKSTDATYKEYDNGDRKKIRDGKYGWRFTYDEGGLALHTKIKTFDGKQDAFDVAFFDKNNGGLMMTSRDGITAKGFSLSMIDVPNYKQAGFSDPSEYFIEFGLANSDEMNLYPIFVPFPDDFDGINDLNGLYDLEMSILTDMDNTGLFDLKLTAGNRAVDLYDDYNNVFDDTLLYDVTNAATGGSIAVTSITPTPATKSWAVQLDGSDPNFPAAAGDLIKIAIGDVSDIESAGAPGYGESEIVAPRG